MGKLLDFLKRTAGEASLHSGLGLWRQKVSAAIDAMGGGGVFDWAATELNWTINAASEADITDVSINHTSATGRVRVSLQFVGLYGESGSDVNGVLLVDGVLGDPPAFMALPDTADQQGRGIGWWILDVGGAQHNYMPRIRNGGLGAFTIDSADTPTQYVILSVEDVAAAP